MAEKTMKVGGEMCEEFYQAFLADSANPDIKRPLWEDT